MSTSDTLEVTRKKDACGYGHYEIIKFTPASFENDKRMVDDNCDAEKIMRGSVTTRGDPSAKKSVESGLFILLFPFVEMASANWLAESSRC